MELYVVVGYKDYGYEGFSEPTIFGVYTTIEQAQIEKEKYIDIDFYINSAIIKKIVVNKPIDISVD